ncbi:hypothetical protein GJ744_011910 [Endocarpon pusillum]|uniref:Uncharacterized protein n=1 Tax=Endocarpon pusillum TaxID=364733 RepID=A0A8H7E1V7_9EURO|nr:hypothetical protein GJ744_011910 [Endocarpon pusillum]
MFGLRSSAVRASRLSRTRLPTRNIRFQSTSSPNSPSKPTNTNQVAILGGAVGGSLVFLAAYTWYHFSGAKTVVQTASQTKAYFDQTLKKTKESAPAPNEAIQWLRETALSYAAIIPGGKGYVDSAFNDLETIHAKHREEVDRIVKEAYEELKELGNKPFSASSVANAWNIVQKHLGRIGELAKDAGGDILNNHPQLRDQFGGQFDRLKSMADNYGPEAKKQVDETWSKIQDALKGGFSFDTLNRVRGIVQETTEKVQQIGEQAWQKAMEQAKPYLDKNPQIKELIESNKTKLIQGNAMELVSKIKDAFSSGSTQDLEKYVQETVSKASSSSSSGMGGTLEKYFQMIPSGGSIWSSLSQLQEGAQKHGKEAEKLLKEATDEVQQVLSRKAEEAKKLAEKAKKDVSK